MHVVAQLHTFARAAAAAGMTEDDVTALVDFLAENPTAGDEIVGTGGCRKLRVAGRGKGKRGGYRIVTFYTGTHFPLFLITVFSKAEKADLTARERNALREITKEIVAEYRMKAAR